VALEEALERMPAACAGEMVWVVMVLPRWLELELESEVMPTASLKILLSG